MNKFSNFFDDIMGSLEAIYVIEEETKKIVYVNNYIAQGKPEKFIGKHCYEAFIGREDECPFCPKRSLLANSEPYYTWDYFDTRTQDWLKINNRVVSEEGVVYRIGNANTIKDMMDLGADAVKEIGELTRLMHENEAMKKALDYEFSHDSMTRLFNRNQYSRDIADFPVPITNTGIIYIDINNLKITNDLYKHSAGDMLIKNIGSALLGLGKDASHAYRIGGDEFLIIYRGSEHGFNDLYERFDKALEEINKTAKYKCDIAIGKIYAAGETEIEALVHAADRLMYEDKARKKANK